MEPTGGNAEISGRSADQGSIFAGEINRLPMELIRQSHLGQGRGAAGEMSRPVNNEGPTPAWGRPLAVQAPAGLSREPALRPSSIRSLVFAGIHGACTVHGFSAAVRGNVEVADSDGKIPVENSKVILYYRCSFSGYSGTPSLLNRVIMGHLLVKAD
jgi:hypothetical protein